MSNYQVANTASEDIEKYRARSNAARELSSHVEHNGSQFVANWDNAFLDYMASQQNEAGQAIGYEEASRRWTSGNAKDRIWVEEQANDFIKSQASHLLDLQNLDDWQEPTSRKIPNVKGQTEIEFIADQNKEGITLERMNPDALLKSSDNRHNSLTRSVSEIAASNSDSIEQQQTQIQTDVQGQGLSDANSGLIDRNKRGTPRKQSNLTKFHFLTGETRLKDN